jgi:hypothetical protein
VTDLNITVLGDEGDSNDWTKQKSPRKRKPTPSRNSQAVPGEQSLVEGPTTAARDRRRTARSAQPIKIREDTDAEEDVDIDTAVDSDSPELRSIDLNRVAVRSRSMSIRQRRPVPASQDTGIDEDIIDLGKDIFNDDPKNISMISTSYPTPDPSVQDDLGVDEPAPALPDDQEGFDTILESEGFTMIDLESIPSARHFFSSPLEARDQAKPPESITNLQRNDGEPSILLNEQTTPSAVQPAKLVPRAIPSYLTLLEGESDISSNVPSSPPVLSQPRRPTQSSLEPAPPRETTPQIYSSPKLPSPPKAAHPCKSKDGARLCKSTPPTLAKVVKAGIALQGVLSPKSTYSTQRAPGGTPEERLNNLFDGFDSGTRRELRAGLRFGEELAKRQRSSTNAKKSHQSPDPREKDADLVNRVNLSVGMHVPATQVWRGQPAHQHTPPRLPINERKEDRVPVTITSHDDNKLVHPRRKSSLCKEINFASSTPQTDASYTQPKSIGDSQKRRELEWQREREAVSKEIESASSSQVVVIDSDEDQDNKSIISAPAEGVNHGEQSELDIWCEEAASCEQRSSKGATRAVRASRADISPDSEQRLREAHVQEGNSKPRRSLIPSPWRRGDNIAGESSYVSNGDMTGLFYHEPKTKIKFGAAEIERQKKQCSSGSFDIDRMAGIPRKTHVVGSQISADEADSLETMDSDAQQLQAELGMNQSRAYDVTDVSQTDSEETYPEPSLVEEAEAQHIDTLCEFTEGDTSFSLQPQPVKIPVNFNDSTVSHIAPCLIRSSPSTAPESSRPNTPRSALKGVRQSLGLEDVNSPAVRKVVFSSHETRIDLDGQEEQLSMQSVSSTREVFLDCDEEEAEDSQQSISEAKQDSPTQAAGLLGWLWGSSKKTKSCPPPPVDGANDREPRRPATQRNGAPNPTKPTRTAAGTPSYLLPPSYPSDPTRDTQIPMSTCGEFMNTHFRTLHIIYAKSIRPRFHAPKAHDVRPSLRELLGITFEADESQSGLGIFEWQVDEMALRVVERFMREVEWGYPAGSSVTWTWSEREICERLFRVVVGEEVRKEEKAAFELGRF